MTETYPLIAINKAKTTFQPNKPNLSYSLILSNQFSQYMLIGKHKYGKETMRSLLVRYILKISNPLIAS